MRLEGSEVRLCFQTRMLHITDNADDRQPGFTFGRPYFDSFANSLFRSYPESSRHCFIDDGDIGRSPIVALIKLASAEQGNAHRAKIIWQDATKTCGRGFAGIERATLNGQLAVAVAAGDRQCVDRADGANSRYGFQSFGKLLIELNYLRSLLIL